MINIETILNWVVSIFFYRLVKTVNNVKIWIFLLMEKSIRNIFCETTFCTSNRDTNYTVWIRKKGW